MTSATLSPPELQRVGPPQALCERLLARSDELTVLPAVATEAIELARDPDCSISRFSALVERDLKLASDILSMANSAMYARGHSVTSLNQAVLRLGFRHCKNLILSSSLSSLMQRVTLEQQWIRDILWRHSLVTAILGHHLNQALGTAFDGEEFIAGMIHDLGRMLLAVACPESYEQIDSLTFVETAETLSHERKIVETDHAEFGAWFVQRSGLPESLADVVRGHHDCRDAGKLVALTAAADHMANHLQMYLEPDAYVPEDNPGILRLVELGLPKAAICFKAEAASILETSANDLVELTRRMR
jgi:HD-like signal output (HDOD) protein